MIIIRTKNKITIAQARNFEDEQGLKGIKKENIFSLDDCKWELQLGSYTLREGFSVPVSWYQLQEYETGDPANPIGIQKVLMFRENFQLSEAEMQNIWEEIGGTILATDNLAQKMDDFVVAGTMYWIGTVREIFGLDETGFEVV